MNKSGQTTVTYFIPKDEDEFVPSSDCNYEKIFSKKFSREEDEQDSFDGYVSIIVDLIYKKKLKNQLATLRRDGTEYYISPKITSTDLGSKFISKYIIDTKDGCLDDFGQEKNKEISEILEKSSKLATITKQINKANAENEKINLKKEQKQIQDKLRDLIDELSKNGKFVVKKILPETKIKL